MQPLLPLLSHRPETASFILHGTEYVDWIAMWCYLVYISIKTLLSTKGCWLQNTKKTMSYFCVAFAGKEEYYNIIGFNTTMAIIYNKDVRENV